MAAGDVWYLVDRVGCLVDDLFWKQNSIAGWARVHVFRTLVCTGPVESMLPFYAARQFAQSAVVHVVDGRQGLTTEGGELLSAALLVIYTVVGRRAL